MIQLGSVIVMSLLVVLIAFGGNSGTAEQNNAENKSQVQNDSLSYEYDIEHRIESIVNSISGVSEASAFVYTKGSVEVVYGEDSSTKLSSEDGSALSETSSVVFSKDGTKTVPVIIKKNYPIIEGVLVVAKGADDEKKRIMIINALASVLGININSIEVLAG